MSLDLSYIHLAVLGLAAALLIAAALRDANTYRIPNVVSFALLALFPVYVLTSPQDVPWGQHLFTFGLVLACGFVLFAKKYAGAGDIKLLAVMGLWAGPQFLAVFLFVTAVAGGLLGLAIAALTYRRNHLNGDKKLKTLAKTPIPYGVAIAIGGLCTLMMLSHPALFSASIL